MIIINPKEYTLSIIEELLSQIINLKRKILFCYLNKLQKAKANV